MSFVISHRGPRRAAGLLLVLAAAAGLALPMPARAVAAAIPSPAANGDLAWGASDGLWVADQWGNHPRKIAPSVGVGMDAGVGGPSWSHDGTRIAYSTGTDIWTVRADGSDRRQVTNTPSIDDGRPMWFPADDRILYHSRGSVQSIRPDGRDWQTIPTGEYGGPASLSPDGTRIVVRSTSPDFRGLATMNLDGSGVTRITDGAGGDDGSPSWSPDGTRILFTRSSLDAFGAPEAAIVNVDGSQRRGLPARRAVGWSPDGRFVLVSGDSPARVLRMLPDGSDARSLGGCAWTSSDMSWQPVADRPTRSAASWGWNGVGQLGNGTTTDSQVPAGVPLSAVVSVASGFYHSIALREDGSVWTWGWNAYGQIGDGTRTDRAAPVPVTGLPPVACIAAGGIHTVAVDAGGRVWTWGSNAYGQLGDDTTVDRLRPVRLPIDWVRGVAAGAFHTLAFDDRARASAWGHGGVGQLAQGSTTDSHSPDPVHALRVKAVAAGAFHSLALTMDGEVMTWGWNPVGQLGDGSTVNQVWPVRAALPLYSRMNAIAAGAVHNLVVGEDGTVWTWGGNNLGQLGDASTVDRHLPQAVSGVSGVVVLGAGWGHSVVVSDAGRFVAWGWNAGGQLGDGTTVDRHTPVPVAGVTGAWTVAGGALHTLGLS